MSKRADWIFSMIGPREPSPGECTKSKSAVPSRRQYFAFTVLEVLRGAEAAKSLQPMLEYDPASPFQIAHSRAAAPEPIEKVRLLAEEVLRQHREVSTRVASTLGY